LQISLLVGIFFYNINYLNRQNSKSHLSKPIKKRRDDEEDKVWRDPILDLMTVNLLK